MMKDVVTKGILASALLLGGSLADWQFRSRSDLAPPRINITIPAADDVEQGYLFVAPFAGLPDTPSEQHGPRQAGPYIFRDDGDLVWSGYAIFSIWSTNFQAARWGGEDVLFSFEGDHNAGYGHGHGHITFVDQHYETIRELRAGNHKLVDKHEFHVVNEETGLIQIYQPVARDLTPWGAKPEQQWIVNAIIQGKSSHSHSISAGTNMQKNSISQPARSSSSGPASTMLPQTVGSQTRVPPHIYLTSSH